MPLPSCTDLTVCQIQKLSSASGKGRDILAMLNLAVDTSSIPVSETLNLRHFWADVEIRNDVCKTTDIKTNTIDVGKYIHRYLIENVHIYNNLVYANEHRWTHAENGLLGGKVIQYQKDKHLLVLSDFNKSIWQVDLRNAEVRPGTRLVPGKHLKITGIITGTKTFKSLTVQGWSKRYQKHPLQAPKTAPIKHILENEKVAL